MGKAILLMVLALGLPSCTKKPKAAMQPTLPGPVSLTPAPLPNPQPSPEPAVDPQQALIARGQAVYLASCSACHGTNPRQVGTLGPDLYGSSLALIEARVLKSAYPPGYTPKRRSKAMLALPQVKADIPALYAFLNAE